MGEKKTESAYVRIEVTVVPLKKKITYLGMRFDRVLNFIDHTRRRKGLAEHRIQRLYQLIKLGSNLSLPNRLLIAKNICLPMANYGQEVWINGVPAALKSMQVAQTKILRRALGLPYYVKNLDILRDTKSPDSLELARERRAAAVRSLVEHPEIAIQERGRLIEESTRGDR